MEKRKERLMAEFEELKVRNRNLEAIVAGLKQELAVAKVEERVRIVREILAATEEGT